MKENGITRKEFIKSSALLGAAATLDPTHLFAEVNQIPEFSPYQWAPRPLKKKPNILMVVLDDIGFGDLGCYGAEHSTDTIDRIANEGVMFNNFHVTALCAPTRACLLTGRNAHAVGVGNIAEWGRNHPGYRGWIRKDASTLSEILRPQGYSTYAIGKWHLTSLEDQNGSGPFDQWPTGRGFDRWYGFHGNAMDHWHPEMFENTSAAYPNKAEDYHLSTDLVSKSIQYIRDHITSSPERPFFTYLAFGACHFPLHAPKDDIHRKKGMYDHGWDAVRQKRFRRQIAEGIIPQDTRLSERNDTVPQWNSLSSDQKKFAARGQEIYAAFLEHTDRQIDQLMQFLKKENQYDDTIVIVLSDNGAAYGGPIEGRIDVRRDAYLGRSPFEERLSQIDTFGSDASYGMHSRGWSQASNTPLKWFKADTYGGGTRSPLIFRWGNGDLDKSKIRTQYTHAIDLVPTLLEMIQVSNPEVLNGEKLLPIQGKSFAYAFDHADAPTTKKVQYFETLGDRAIWADGWKAVTKHKKGDDYDNDVWELYHTDTDFSESTNLASEHPDKLQQLIDTWNVEAKRYNILPMEDDTLKLYYSATPPPRAHYVFYPQMTRLDRLSAPDIYNHDTVFRADVNIEEDWSNINGVLLASGDSGAGYEWFISNGKVYFVYVYTRHDKTILESSEIISQDVQVLELRMKKKSGGKTTLSMYIDEREVGMVEILKMWPIATPNSGLRCGENQHAPISRMYDLPHVFNQTLKRIDVIVSM